MYVTAHRIRLKSDRTGVNAFLHLHGDDFAWPSNPIDLLELADSPPGQAVDRVIKLRSQGGNPLLSYLDIIAPDGTPRSELTAFIDLLAATDPQDHGGLYAIVQKPLAARVSLPPWLLRKWRNELRRLVDPIEDLLRQFQWA